MHTHAHTRTETTPSLTDLYPWSAKWRLKPFPMTTPPFWPRHGDNNETTCSKAQFGALGSLFYKYGKVKVLNVDNEGAENEVHSKARIFLDC